MSDEGQVCLQCALGGGRERVAACPLLWEMRTPLARCGTSPFGWVVSDTAAILPWGGLGCISSVNPSIICFSSADF